MILLLAHRLELSACDDLALGAEITHWLLQQPRYVNAEAFTRYPRGVLSDIEDAERLLGDLLPEAVFSVLPMLPGRPFFIAAVDATAGAVPPFLATARTMARALVAATFRSFAHDLDTQLTIAAENCNAPAGTLAMLDADLARRAAR